MIRKEKEKLSNYLFLKDEFPYKNKWFKVLILKTDLTKDIIINLVDIFENIFGDIAYTTTDNEIIIIYFGEIDFSLEEVLLSVSDDFGINVLGFSMPKIYTNNNNFLEIYELYKKYIFNKHQGYFTISDLILEAMVEYNDIKILKAIVLDKILSDPQNETLILAMFKNDLNILKTSKKIYMHRNTINNRLDLIKRESDLNIQKFQDAVAIYNMLKLK